MKLICVDIGNTNIVFGLYKNHRLITVKRINTNDIEKNLNFISSINKEDNIAVSSVVPQIEKMLSKKIPRNQYFSVSYSNSNINLIVDIPNQVGNDRLCNIKSIIKKKLNPAIIIDFGSATTYDVVDENKNFIGGVIAPGINISAQHLFKKAAQLDRVDFKFPQSVIGKNTTTNLQSGIMYGGVDAVNGMIQRIKNEANNIKNIILTGGFATVLSPKIKHTHIVDTDLTLKGIKLIWEENL